ncbi:putative small lipoprotein YifL [Pantoea alhagi]|uniref:LPS translocon maturation chaperone LptM n=1 Tax=Mixta sp. BE291 TaxID=3158787 RepID=UPI0028643B8B|nr:putative small lipoprotein YifL [Pantoea alhagi]
MKKTICRLAMALALTSLAGCGLKGPLYFPPQDKPKQSSPQPAAEQPASSSTATQPDGQQDTNLTSPDADMQATQ